MSLRTELLQLLPKVSDEAEYERLWRDDDIWAPLVRAIAAHHGLRAAPERYRSGTAVAYRLGDAVLKLYPPFAAGDADLERWVLERIEGVEGLPSPRPLAVTRLGDWSYLLMTHLPGTPIDGLWAALPAPNRQALGHQIGRLARALHSVSPAGLPRLDDDWSAFRRHCRERAEHYHVARGFPAERSGELSALLRDLDREPEVDDGPVLLHTELGPGHLLVDRHDADRVTGLFDFAEARAGLPEYDLAAVGLLVTRGDRAAFRAVLDGYQLPESRRGAALVRRLLRHALLHQYGHLSFYFSASPVPDPSDLHAAGEHWFGHAP
jgi:hygromycin-B 7''-O-kinase